MPKRPPKTVLFLCTGNYYRSRFSEILFNHVAGKFGLAWNASSRGLVLERGAANVGPMAAIAIKALEKMGVRAEEDVARFPLPVTTNDLEQANFIVALKQAEHLSLLQERFPASVERVEFWEVNDDPAAIGLIEREVMDLISRLHQWRQAGCFAHSSRGATKVHSVSEEGCQGEWLRRPCWSRDEGTAWQGRDNRFRRAAR